MKLLIVAAALLLTACSGLRPDIYVVDSEFTHYIEQFKEDCSCEIDVSQIAFKSLEYVEKLKNPEYEDFYTGTVGLCRKWNNGKREIFIDPSYWYSVSYGYRITLMYHELGHCVLDQDHRENSIMHGYNFNAYSESWDWYVDELLGRI